MRLPARPIPVHRAAYLFAALCGWLLLVTSCAAPPTGVNEVDPDQVTPVALTVLADGESRQLASAAATVGDALAEAGISLNPFDEVDPPLMTPLSVPAIGAPLVITIVRVTETLEVIPESLPYERRIVRSAEMSSEDPPRILQTGRAGLQEISYRIVFRDGLEAERWPTAVNVIDPPVDEIIMIGLDSEDQVMPLAGRLAYINGGRAIILSGSTDSPRQLPLDGQLDGRVFQLSPGGNYLLYTISKANGANQTAFRNELWVIPTAEGGQPRSLQIENVLWAGWDPAGLDPHRIAYTTARSVSLPPGWEANNDLWVLEVSIDDPQPAPVRLVETYPAAFAWWGGSYAWSLAGDSLAYAFADEVGLLDMPDSSFDDGAGFVVAPEPVRTVLHTFAAFDTGADWAWVPALGWSADGSRLAFTEYSSDSGSFDLWTADRVTGVTTPIIESAGIWSSMHWSPAALPDSELAVWRADDPAQGETGSYSLWLYGANSGNARRLFPPEGESGQFARSNQSFAWGPGADSIAFIFNDELHILNLATDELFQAGLDDTVSSHPTWAPYGSAAGR